MNKKDFTYFDKQLKKLENLAIKEKHSHDSFVDDIIDEVEYNKIISRLENFREDLLKKILKSNHNYLYFYERLKKLEMQSSGLSVEVYGFNFKQGKTRKEVLELISKHGDKVLQDKTIVDIRKLSENEIKKLKLKHEDYRKELITEILKETNSNE